MAGLAIRIPQDELMTMLNETIRADASEAISVSLLVARCNVQPPQWRGGISCPID